MEEGGGRGKKKKGGENEGRGKRGKRFDCLLIIQLSMAFICHS